MFVYLPISVSCCLYACLHILHICVHVCMYMYACMYACILRECKSYVYVFMNVYVCTYVCRYMCTHTEGGRNARHVAATTYDVSAPLPSRSLTVTKLTHCGQGRNTGGQAIATPACSQFLKVPKNSVQRTSMSMTTNRTSSNHNKSKKKYN